MTPEGRTAKILRIAEAMTPDTEQQILILGRAYVAACRKVEGARSQLAVTAIKRMFDEAANSIITEPKD